MKKHFWFLISMISVLASLASIALGQEDKNKGQADNGEVSILVTAMPHNDRTRQIAARLQSDDFEVFENKKAQKILSVKKAAEAPPMIAILIQDNLVGRVNNELDEIKEFIRGLPNGSQVMTAYIRTGSLQVRQEFTKDLEKAAKSLRILASSDGLAPYSPFGEVIEALPKFDSLGKGRKMILLISDGLDLSLGFRGGSPFFSVDLARAITKAQLRSVAIFTIYAPSVGLTSFSRRAANFGQGSLNRISDETGGESFFSGTDFVTFNPYFREFKELLGNQWLISYRSATEQEGFRRIEVKTDFDIHLHHPAGYEPK